VLLGGSPIQSEFIDPLNDKKFGGYSDWRLPTIMELYTIHKSSCFLSKSPDRIAR
jgi:hypothetical protein